MHGDGGTRHHGGGRHSQVLRCRQLDLRSIIQKLFLHSVVKFLPAVVRERGDIVENEAAVFGIEFPGSFRIPSAPSRAEVVDELAKGSVVRGLLLRPGSYEGQQGADDRQHHIQHPTPPLGIIVDSSAHRCGHSVSPGNSGNESLQGDVPTREAYRSPFAVILQGLLCAPFAGGGAIRSPVPPSGTAVCRQIAPLGRISDAWLRRDPYSRVGPGNGSFGGQHGGPASNFSKHKIDCGSKLHRTPPGNSIYQPGWRSSFPVALRRHSHTRNLRNPSRTGPGSASCRTDLCF